MPRVAHFEIHASEPEQLVAFYTELFGWKMQHVAHIDYWLIDTAHGDEPGINGGLLKRQGPKPADGQAVNAHMCTVNVPSVDAYFAHRAEAGRKRRVAEDGDTGRRMGCVCERSRRQHLRLASSRSGRKMTVRAVRG